MTASAELDAQYRQYPMTMQYGWLGPRESAAIARAAFVEQAHEDGGEVLGVATVQADDEEQREDGLLGT